jgi:FkbM family methyltransferase
MSKFSSDVRRFVRFLRLLPEASANALCFRVFFLLPRWFRMPTHIRVAGRSSPLHFPAHENAESDFIDCVLRNSYGLGCKLGNVRTIVDVGANVGFFSLAARQRYPNAVIHAYEPNPRVLPYFDANTDGLDIVLHPEAVGDWEGFVTILDEGPSDEARTRAGEGSIRQVSLNTAIERIGGSIDLLKLDCEGAEWEILKLDGCWERVKNIRMEFHMFNGETVDQAHAAIARIGFKIIHLDEHNPEMGTMWSVRA